MNYIWAIMLILGIAFSVINDNITTLADNLLMSSAEAIEFILGLTGILCLWSGFMKIAEKSGLIEKLAQLAMPFISYIFPEEKNTDTLALMLMSFSANIFGAGNSATVFSLKVMQRLDDENKHSPIATNTMCMFMAVSMSMIQLVPVALIKVRQDLGSEVPGSIIIPSILSGLVSMAVSIAFCKFIESRKTYNE